MNPWNRLDLHHLRALDAVLAERSVTRAAARLSLTPSAVSHALRGLRDTLDDPLLVRGPGGMVPTPRAESLQGPLHQALRDLERALQGGDGFDPAASTRTFRLLMPDSLTLTVLPDLLALVRAEAPGVDLDVRPTLGSRTGLEDGEADVAFVVGTPLDPTLRSRALLDGHLACCVRADHPDVGDVLDLDTFCRLPHALMSPTGTGTGVVDTALAALGRSRRVHLRIRYFLAAPLVVARSDLVLTGPRDLLSVFADLAPLRVLDAPLPLAPFTVKLVWPERLHDDPGHRWLRRAVVQAAELEG